MSFRLSYRRYSLGFKEPVRTAHGPWGVREGFIVRVETSGAAAGYGEVAPIPWFGTESVEEAEQVLRRLGSEFDERALLAVAADHPCTVGALRTAIEQAGAAPRAVADSKDYLQIAALLPAGRRGIDRARALAESGFRVFKWKVGVDDSEDELAILDDLLACLPEGAKLRLDANGAWDRKLAERWLARCAERPVEYLEQPVSAESRNCEDTLLGLAQDYPTDIALDESLVSDGDFERWLGLGWHGVYVLKPLLLGDARGRCGELLAAKAKVVFSSSLETAVGASQVLKLAFAWGGERRALGLGVWPLFDDSRFDGPALAPFIRAQDLNSLNPDIPWNALS